MSQIIILTMGDCYALNCIIDTVLSIDFVVIRVESCVDALKYLHSNLNIKAIVIDISDLTSENFELIEHINSSSILTRIEKVVISDSNDVSLRNNVLEMGSLLFLTKPFDPVHLSNSLKVLLSKGKSKWSFQGFEHTSYAIR